MFIKGRKDVRENEIVWVEISADGVLAVESRGTSGAVMHVTDRYARYQNH